MNEDMPRADSELVKIAREVCFEWCRALICEQRGYCTNTYPGDGSGCWFPMHFPEAQRRLAERDAKGKTE